MLSQDFFARDTAVVARELVGCRLVVEQGGELQRFQITETEGYLGPEDTASHARFGKTDRSEIMYGSAGVMYVYLIYGMHHMLNIVTGPEGEPGAVLIRGIEGYDGPGKLTKHLGITKKTHDGQKLGVENEVWIESRPDDFDASSIMNTPRIGIDYANDEWRDKPLRFVLSEA